MMTAEHHTVSWGQLIRRSKHRTSAPTDTAIRRAIADIVRRRGRKPNADSVLLAALRLADPAALAAEVREIEEEMHSPVALTDETPE